MLNKKPRGNAVIGVKKLQKCFMQQTVETFTEHSSLKKFKAVEWNRDGRFKDGTFIELLAEIKRNYNTINCSFRHQAPDACHWTISF